MLEGDSSTTTPSAGITCASVAWTAAGLSGKESSGVSGAASTGGAVRSAGLAASASAASVSATSATRASPIGALAASSGSLVIATSRVPAASSGPGMLG